MLIANPIYDIVFKYLMEDLDIAKDILSLILNTEIISLTVQPQETTSEVKISDKPPINIYRLDFVAVFKEADGSTKKALIELQKTKRSTNVTRFRKYLGENYKKEDKTIVNGVEIAEPLELITIYLLGFELDDVPVAVMKVKNCFVDAVTGNTLPNEPKDKFIRLLNHESYTIQIPKLQPNLKSRLEQTLNVFNQKYQTSDVHTLNYDEDTNDPLIAKIVSRLMRAIADETLKRQMDFEDEIETELKMLDVRFDDVVRESKNKDNLLIAKDKELLNKDNELKNKDSELKNKDNLLSTKDNELSVKDKELEANRKEIEELKRLLNK